MQSAAHETCEGKWFKEVFKRNKINFVCFCFLLFFFQDKKADLVVSTYVDTVLEKVCKSLGVEILEYTEEDDPTKQGLFDQEWTIQTEWVKDVEKQYTAKLKAYRELTRKRKSGADKNEDEEEEVVEDKKEISDDD